MTPKAQPETIDADMRAGAPASEGDAAAAKIPLAMRLYGALCTVLGVFTLFSVIVFAALMT